MNLFITRANTGHQLGKTIYGYPNYLSRNNEPVDFFQSYQVNDSATLSEGFSNPSNLFDDSDKKDKYWLSIALECLSSL